jgi:Tol biopolymer transport system component
MAGTKAPAVLGAMALTMLGTAAGAFSASAPAAATPPSRTMHLAAAGAVAEAGPAGIGASVGLPRLVAYVRLGDIWVSKGATRTKLTTGGGWSRPRFSPDGRSIALIKAGRLWTMKADGSAKRQLTTRSASGPSWSPDSTTIAFASLSCSGGPGVYRISATKAAASPTVVFPASCRGENLPAEPAPTAKAAPSSSLSDRLRTDDAVAWSPDGTRVAFRGGDCESTYDACLTVGTLASGVEKTVAAYGGGSLQTSGFAVVPHWRADGAKLSWTAYQQGETPAENEPLHVVEYDTATGAKRTVGASQDRELAYLDTTRAVATGTYRNGSWIVLVNLATGARTPLQQGSQPSIQPVG